MQEHVRKAQTILTFFLDEILLQKKLDQVISVLSENLIATIPGLPGEFCDRKAFIGYLREVVSSEKNSCCSTYQISSVKILPNEEVFCAVIFSNPVEQSFNLAHTFPETAYFTLVREHDSYLISTIFLHQFSCEKFNLQAEDPYPAFQEDCINHTEIFGYYLEKEYPLFFCSPQFLTLLGYSTEEFQNRFEHSIENLFDPNDLEKVKRITEESDHLSSEPYMLIFRTINKDGNPVWLNNRGKKVVTPSGRPAFVWFCVDISELITVQTELNYKKDQYRRLVESTGSTIFDYDMELDQMELFLLSETRKKKNFQTITIKNFSRKGQPELDIIHPADHDRAVWFLRNRQPINGSEMRFRVAGLDPADYYWHEIYGSVSSSMDGKENRYIGMLRFIDNEKKRILDLTNKAERDSLTKLYNKLSVEQIINQSIDSDSAANHAFLLLDIDHFKIINDSTGHPFGDIILKLFAKLLTETFRTNDVIGRIGGDEFVVFMRDIRDKADVFEKAKRLITEFQKEFVFRNLTIEEKNNCRLCQSNNCSNVCQIHYSCSIGISFYVADGSNFYQLYHAADAALYQAKEGGRNQYVCYQKADQVQSAENPVLLPPTGEPLEN